MPTLKQKPTDFVELSRITLARPVKADEGTVPAGAIGTIAHIWHSGKACEVEFIEPFHAIATVKANDITG